MTDVKEVPVYVGKISIDGIKDTNHEFIKKQMQQERFFSAKSLEEVLLEINSVKHRLEELEIFKKISVKLDKFDPGANEIGSNDCANLHVIFAVEEARSRRFDAKAMCGLDNSVGMNLEMIHTNVRGRAAKIDLNYHHNINGVGGGSVTVVKPLEGAPGIKCAIGAWDTSFDHWWSQFLETTSGGFGEVSFKTALGQHQFRLESLWREIVISDKAPLEVAKESGHSVKSSLKHTFTRDTRDDRLYPEHGYRLSLAQEMFSDMASVSALHASRLSNINLKLEAELQKAISFRQFVFENTFNCGIIRSLTKSDTNVPIADRFFIGGPLTMRGFELRSMGPLTRDRCPLGSNFYFQHGFHLYSPLPFFNKEGYASHFRLHGFLTSAVTESSLYSSTSDTMASGDMATRSNRFSYQVLQHMFPAVRTTAGMGIIFKLANAFRIELNYCLPLRVQPTDRVVHGFQFGIGILYT